jgi:hypothetical protein
MQDQNQQNNKQTDNVVITDPVLPFIPKIVPSSPSISVGGVESGAQIKVERSPQPLVENAPLAPEQERALESYEQADVKEPKSPTSAKPVSTVPVTQVQIAEEKKESDKPLVPAFEPKLIGHKIDRAIIDDEISMQESLKKGDPSLARTGIYFLLERLRKKIAK